MNYENWEKDEVIMTNHPCAGGSHLPDITVITPIWENNKPIFFVASRGHHADVGGSTPGSMYIIIKKIKLLYMYIYTKFIFKCF